MLGTNIDVVVVVEVYSGAFFAPLTDFVEHHCTIIMG